MTILEAGPRPALGWTELAIAVLLLAALVPADVIGRLLLLPPIGALLALGVRDLLLRPVLQAGPDGLSVVVGARRLGLAWDEVHRARVVTDRRAPLLELDLGETVVVLSRRRLGAPPSEVLTQLEALRPAPGPTSLH